MTPAVATTCPYCGVGCGVGVAHTATATTVVGDTSHPANLGRLCSKGAALGETVHLPDRLSEPLRRDAEAGTAGAMAGPRPRPVAARFRMASELRAKEMTMPRAKSVVPSADPPLETSGSGTPMTGSTPMTEPMLIIAWTRIHVMTPAVATRTNGSSVRSTIR